MANIFIKNIAPQSSKTWMAEMVTTPRTLALLIFYFTKVIVRNGAICLQAHSKEQINLWWQLKSNAGPEH